MIDDVLAGKVDHTILQGDSETVLATLPADLFHAAMCSPPYYCLRSYLPDGHPDKASEIGLEQTVEEYLARLVAVFREVKRVLRPDGLLAVNMGESYANPSSGGGSVFSNGRTDGRAFYASDEAKVVEARGPVTAANKLDGLPAGACMDIPSRLKASLIADGWLYRGCVVWRKLCLSAGTVLYARTQKGDMPSTLKDLVRLDPKTVKLWNGQRWTQVVGWHQNPEPGVPLQLEFRTGQKVVCTKEHVWPTERGEVPAALLRVGDVVRTCRLPEPSEPARPGFLPDAGIGWLVGFFMAEGFLTPKSVGFALHADETEYFERIAFAARQLQATARMRRMKGKAAVVHVHGKAFRGVIQQYVAGHGSKGKHLTNACWMRSDAFLLNLLVGYLDGDGCHDRKNNRHRLGFASNDEWASQLRLIGARLGISVRLRRCTFGCNGKRHPGYRGEVRLDQPGHHFNRKDNGEIVAIRPAKMQARAFWDVEVEDDPHWFALASGLLTHNSPMPASLNGWKWEKCRVKVKGYKQPQRGDEEKGRRGCFPQADGSHKNGVEVAQWSPCPGCPKCEPHGGLVLRRGSWRPTPSWEPVFLFCRQMAYYGDGEGVKQPTSAESDFGRPRPLRPMPSGVGDDVNNARTKARLGNGSVGNPAGANLRDVWDIPDPSEVWRWLSEQGSPELQAELSRLYPAWLTGDMQDVWALGPSPLADAHYAAYPPALVTRFLRFATSERGVCPWCGSPWARVVEKADVNERNERVKTESSEGFAGATGHAKRTPSDRVRSLDGKNYVHVIGATLGWRQTCVHCKVCAERGHDPEKVHASQRQGSGKRILAPLEAAEEGQRPGVRGAGHGPEAEVPEAVCPVREGVSRHVENGEVLQPDVFGEMDVGERRGEPLPAVRDEQVRSCQEEREADQGSPCCNGGTPGAQSGKVGTRPPQKRRQKRQPAGEPGTDNSHPPREETHQQAPDHDIVPFDPIPALILDPFSGAGSTGVAARRLGLRYVGVELSENYVTLSRKRLAGCLRKSKRQKVKDAASLFDALEDAP